MPLQQSIEDVRTYLMECNPDLASQILGILRNSVRYGKNESVTYVVRECEKCDPNSPIVHVLRQKENKWPEVMKVGDEVAKERGIKLKRLYE